MSYVNCWHYAQHFSGLAHISALPAHLLYSLPGRGVRRKKGEALLDPQHRDRALLFVVRNRRPHTRLRLTFDKAKGKREKVKPLVMSLSNHNGAESLFVTASVGKAVFPPHYATEDLTPTPLGDG